MSKGELPVAYIIAIVIGVSALALLGYWFFNTGGKFGSQTTATVCDSKFVQFCLTNPSKQWSDFISGADKECSGTLHSFDQCSQVFGIGGSGPTGPSISKEETKKQTDQPVQSPSDSPKSSAPSTGSTIPSGGTLELGQKCGEPTNPNLAASGCTPTPGKSCKTGSCEFRQQAGQNGCFCSG